MNQINLLQWEQDNRLTEDEIQFIKSLEKPDVIPQTTEARNFQCIKNKKENENLVQLQDIQSKYQFKFNQLQNVNTHLGEICTQLSQLNADKNEIIENISVLHSEASVHINAQKEMMEGLFQIQERMQYYTNVQKIQNDLDNADIKEISFQVVNSEITDGIMFFTQNSNYYQSQKVIEQYQSLKKKLFAICKSTLVRIFSREQTFINSKFNHIKDVISAFYPPLPSEPHPLKLQYLQIIFPQLIPKLSIKQRGSQSQYYEDYQKFQITDNLRNFFRYFENQLHIDPDIQVLYNDVFIQFNQYNRFNIHQQIQETLAKKISNPNQIGQVLVKIKQTVFQNKEVTTNEVIIFQTLIGFIFEIFTIEYLYSRTVFTQNSRSIQEANQALNTKIIDLYYQTVKTFLHKINDIDILVQQSDAIEKLKRISNGIIHKTILTTYLNDLIDSLTKNDDKFMKAFEEAVNSQFIDKVKLDLMHKLIQASQYQIQTLINSYQPRDYIKSQGKLVIHKFHIQPAPKSYVLQRKEVYPAVLNGLSIITKMQNCVELQIFQQLAGEVLREINNQLKTVADQFTIKFDSYLFYIKNMIILCDNLTTIGGNYIVTERELDFTETKNALMSILKGQFKPDISWVELNSTEKLWAHTTNFFQFIYKGMPKLNQYEVDWKENLINQKNTILFMFVKDMTFIVSKTLIDFVRKYQYLNHIIEEKLEQAESAQKDMSILIQHSNIKRSYQLFYENLIDFIQEITSKFNNYLELEMFKKIKVYIDEIVYNSIQMLNQFYILVSKHYDGAEYDSFEFVQVDEIMKIITIEYSN